MNIDKKLIAIIISTLIVGFLMGKLVFTSSKNAEEPHKHELENAKNTIWTCSMHPQIRKNEAGKCPICGMDLIPINNENETNGNPLAIKMSPTAMQLANISTAIVGKMNPEKLINLNGKVQADERYVFSQSAHIQGRIEKLTVNYTGEFVTKGQVLATIYSPELVTAQEELFEAQKIKATQPALFNAAKEKLKNWKLSESQIEQILLENKPLEVFSINADVTGYVTQKKVNLGDYVRKGDVIYEIADLSKVWVLFDIYETDISWIKKGNTVSFTINSLPGEKFEGVIAFIDPIIDQKTKVAKARIELANTNNLLLPEMFASGIVSATLANKNNALVVPKTAVMWTGKRSVVYVKSSSANEVAFLLREVTLGTSLGESYIIEQGLQEGEEIAVNGTFSIDAAAQLAGKPSMMSLENKAEIEISLNNKKEIQLIYNAYFELKNALVSDNFEATKKASEVMLKEVNKINTAIFSENAKAIWIKLSSNLKNELQHLPHLANITEIREKFIPISTIMIEITNTFNPLEQPIFVQHCTMADNDKGADWLSLEKEIKNPYFGSKMLKCGEVKKTIK